MYQIKWAAAMLCSVLLLTGCGGSGGGGSDNASGGSQSPQPPAMFTVGGAVSALAGNSVALRLNGGADLIVNANGGFTFPGSVASGTAYSVTVQTQPANPTQTCALANATGNATANVTNVAVTCTTNTYRVGGTLTGLAGGSVVLRDNSGDDLTLSANGAFQFTTPVASGAAYAVTVQTQPAAPAQICVVTQGSGTVAAADVTTIGVNCAPAPTSGFSVGGTVTGLSGPGLILRNNGGSDLAVNANGTFIFNTPVVSGGNYLVTVQTQPPGKLCAVANGSGTVLATNITSVTVTCLNTQTIGGSVRGLEVAGLVLRNAGGDDLTVDANGTFTFATPVAQGGAYIVTAVAGTPASPRHVCQVAKGTGIATADVSDIVVTCEADRFAYVAHFSTVSFDGPGLISALTMNHETGALAPIAGTSTFPLRNGAVQVVADPRGRFIYVAHSAVFTAEGSVSGFSVNPVTGALTPVPGSPFPSGRATNSLAIDSEGWFLYATNRNSDDISGWVIQPDGSLTPTPGSPYRIGDIAMPVSVATTPAGQCCYVYVAHTDLNGVPQVSAYAYNTTTGALIPLPDSPFLAGPDAFGPASLQVNVSGELLYLANAGTSNITTFDIAGGAGTLTQRPGSPTPAINAPCYIYQPRLSLPIFVISSLGSRLGLFGDDLSTSLPTFRDTADLFVGSYCSVATDPYGEFVYVPKADSNFLFGFRTASGGSRLEPLPLNPVPPINTFSLTAQGPQTMVIRYSRRDREVLNVPE